jgi:hypothetical protein
MGMVILIRDMRIIGSSYYLIHGGFIMVKIAGTEIPNLSKIVEDTFDSIGDIYCGDTIEFDDVDTDMDIGMSDTLDDYVPDMDDISSD